MTRKAAKPRVPWQDRFTVPDVALLLSGFAKQHTTLIEAVRSGLLGLEEVSEVVVWRGTWRWTLTYLLDGDPDRAWAYLIPQPGRPVFALPVTDEMVQSLSMKRVSKAIRDGIVLAAHVGGIYWPQWELTGKPLVEELVTLARKKHESLMSATA
jgi:hypothetical protein